MMAALLEVQGLCTEFRTRRGVVRAVDGVDLRLDHGETLGIVGESGCGKSVTALSILRLLPRKQGRIASGRILYDGVDLVSLPESAMRRIRRKRDFHDLPGAHDVAQSGLHRGVSDSGGP